MKCAMHPNREFDPESKACSECGDFDFCYLEWLKEPDKDEWTKGRGRPKVE